MGLPEELYCAMLDVGYSMKKLRGSRELRWLTKGMIEDARWLLQIWRKDKRTMVAFARGVLRGPANLLATTGQLQEECARDCWRYIGLLEYLASRPVCRPDVAGDGE